VRTPAGDAYDHLVRSVRVPTVTGQVGVRPRAESFVLGVEPGLVLARGGDGPNYVGTAGGLLRCDGRVASLMTPLAVSAGEPDEVLARLEEALARPNADLEARATLGRLQRAILRELREVRETGNGRPGGAA
jgi:F0F1-type ATP synthase epsilon subunit